MDDTDRLLHEAGERWRASQPSPRAIDPATLEAGARRSSRFGRLAVGVAAVAIIVGVGVLVRQQAISTRPGGQAICDATLPDPTFVPPSPYLASPPPEYGSEWFGSAGLWTMINRNGETWAQLPAGPGGFTQKTFWLSTAWDVNTDPEPGISVVGRRLDGEGAFSFDKGTNAMTNFGTAMLVGIEIPTRGCWQITGQFRGYSLSYVVQVE